MKRQSITCIFSFGLFILGAMFTIVHTHAYAITDITIAWDPNTAEDLDGYGIYISRGTPGPPFEHYGNVFLDELSDPEIPQITLTGIDDGTYISQQLRLTIRAMKVNTRKHRRCEYRDQRYLLLK